MKHDGKTAFKLRIAFSEGISIGFRTFRDQSLSVSGGSVKKAKRVDRRKDLWKVTVKPGSLGDVTVTLEGGRACGTAGAVCTGDGRALSATISTTVLGPVALSVADARVREASDATLDFAVTLSRASRAPVAVAYATADGSATAGSDYTATSGTLTFAAGETAKTVSVPVLDDAHDEGEETLTLRLSAATGAVIADGVGDGHHREHGPHAGGVAGALRAHGDGPGAGGGGGAAGTAPRAAGARATLAGQALPSWDGANDNADASDRALRADARDRGAMTAIGDWMAHAGANDEWRGDGSGRPCAVAGADRARLPDRDVVRADRRLGRGRRLRRAVGPGRDLALRRPRGRPHARRRGHHGADGRGLGDRALDGGPGDRPCPRHGRLPRGRRLHGRRGARAAARARSRRR